MTWILTALAVSAAGMLAFIALDAHAAFDGNPATPTLSSKLKAWRKDSFGHTGGRTLLMTGVLFGMTFIPAYLFGHLVLELW